MLAGCLAVVGVAGGMATLALHTATASPTQTATATVVVDANEVSGVARLTVLTPVPFRSGSGQRVVAAGTQIVTASSLLTAALPPSSAAAVGDTLSCDMRIGVSDGQPVMDLVHCTPARTAARG